MFSIIGGDGKEYGPVSVEQLKIWIGEHRVVLDTQARRDGTTEWLPLRAFPEFAPQPALAPATPEIGPDGQPLPASTYPAPAAPPAPRKLEFTGDWSEYFKIWIVNVLLTVVTLGIYAAWAKVRKRRYFCANTKALGHSFEYLADPLPILRGNLIVGGIFLVLTFSQAVHLGLYIALALVFALAVPWFIVKSLAFNARNTAWRGLRFHFRGKYGESALAFLLWPLFIFPSLGLIIPFIAKEQKEFVVNNHGYGTTPFSFTGETGAFYKIYGIALLWFLPLFAAYFGLIVTTILASASGGDPRSSGIAPLFALFPVLLLIGIPCAIAGIFYVKSRIFNYVWSNTTLAGNRFAPSMRARDLILIHIVNTIVTALTLGLMHPWAIVRMTKYQVECLEIHPAGNLDQFIAASQPPVDAVGEAANDFFDFELGFGA